MQISIDDSFASNLKRLANKLNCITFEKPSVTKLIEKIATEEISLLSSAEIQKIFTILIANCKYSDMEKFAQILDYKIPQNSVISIIKQKAINKQAFRLSYIDAGGKHEYFDCTYARIKTYENKQYLETAYSNDVESDSIPGLEKNRIFRIDRITDMVQILDINQEWGELNYVKVVYELYGNLAVSYQIKEGETVEAFDGGVRIATNISNDFFFVRKMVRYLDSARILEPKSLAIKLKDSLEQILTKYDWLD